MRPKSGYLPSLDGWRAFAILLVIMQHDQQWHLFRFTNRRFRDYGGFGVWLFFAISGLLICWRILEDEKAQGRFRVKDFYVRRFFRIQPPAWTYLTVIAILILTGVVHEHWHFWLGAFFLYQNFTWHSLQFDRMLREGWFTGHFWTLAVEEHFYILLSLFMVFCKRQRAVLLGIAIFFILLGQALAQRNGLFSDDDSTRRTYWQIQYLLIPALLALVLHPARARAFAIKYLRPWVAFLLTGAIMLSDHLLTTHTRHYFFRLETIGNYRQVLFYCFSLWVAATMLHPASWTTRLLELKPLRYVGRLSYSIYVWHLIFFSTTTEFPQIHWRPLVFAAQRPWRYFFVLGLAMASYYLIEKPAIRLGHRLAPPATPGHNDLRVEAADPKVLPVLHQV